MRKRFWVIVLVGASIAIAFGSVAGTAGNRGGAGPAAATVDPELVGRIKGCLSRALDNERVALRLLRVGTTAAQARVARLRMQRALRALSCAEAATVGDGENQLEDGDEVSIQLSRAFQADRFVLSSRGLPLLERELARGSKASALRRRLIKRIEVANVAKSAAFRAAGTAPPAADHGCEGATEQAQGEDRDDVAARCQPEGARMTSGRASAARVPVNAIELSARRPITRFNDWAVIGGGGFRSGSCTRLAASLIRCPIDPPMQPGQIFVVGLAGLGTGTQVVMQIVSGNTAQYIRLTTK